jgi:beta-galactosidase
MKNTFITLLIYCFFCIDCIAQEINPFWSNEKKMKTIECPCTLPILCLKMNHWRIWGIGKNLNGALKLKYLENPLNLPQDFEKVEYNDALCDDFKIPATWDVNGYEFLVYVNTTHDFAKMIKINPPKFLQLVIL